METHPCECVMSERVSSPPTPPPASMETHPCECVMLVLQAREEADVGASMETHPCECVMSRFWPLHLATVALQWRRTLASA